MPTSRCIWWKRVTAKIYSKATVVFMHSLDSLKWKDSKWLMWKFTNKYVTNNTHEKISKFSRNTGESLPHIVIFVVNILNFSNSFFNPVVYIFRILEFKQALRLSCTEKGTATETGQIEKRYRTTLRTPEKELRKYRTDPTRLQAVFDQEDMETQF